MDFPAVQSTLTDLPDTFTSNAGPYPQLVDSWTTALALFTTGSDGIAAQANFNSAVGGWIDTWGLAFGIGRLATESDSTYQARILALMSAVVGTVPAIQIWISLYAPGGSVSENSPGPGYTITLPSAITTLQYQQFFDGLQYIRPVGVPVIINASSGGLFLGTSTFMGTDQVMGSYLSTGGGAIASPWGAIQNNASLRIPDLYLTDPTLNPSLAA
jgi:hypothetical protein